MKLSGPGPLDGRHELDGFDSGTPALDEWLKRRARADQASGASRTFVMTSGSRVVAYYAIASGAISPAATPGRFRRNMPAPIPVSILGCLTVNRSFQGQGLGRELVGDCAVRVARAADTLGIHGTVVHATLAPAKTFYLAVGFDPSPLEPMTLMVTLTDIQALLESTL